MKKWFTALALAAVSAAAFAASPTPADASAAVEAQTGQILGELKANKAMYQSNPAAFQNYIDSHVVPHFALEQMAQWVLGRHREQVMASSGKFEQFKQEFKRLIIRTYSEGWSNYTNAQLKVLSASPLDKYNQSKVRAVVTNNNGQKNNIVITMWWNGTEWKIFDAVFSNISILTSYRNTFNTALQKEGIDGLLAQMPSMK